MAYTINLTNGTILTTIADGTVNDSSTSLTLIGKNYSGYGTYLNDNLVHLLENSSNSTAPATPLTGQLWWDTAGNLKVYTGSAFKTLAAITSSVTQPSGPVTGNQWWDTVNQQFNIYNGSGWTLIGPAFTSNTGTSGTIVGTILDNASPPQSHVAVNVYVSNTLVAIVSKDSTYTPATAITGFSTIKPGFNLVSTSAVAGVAYWGTASDASTLGNVAALNYARTDIPEVFDSTVSINNNSGLTVGTANNFTAGISGTIVQLTNNINNADIAIRANIGGTLANVISVTGSTGAITVPNVLATSGNLVSSGYMLATQGENATSNVTGALRVTGGIGMTGSLFSTGSLNIGAITSTSTGAFAGNVSAANFTTSGNITASFLVGTAIQSYYADLAERFASDEVYEPGTVVELGGEKEITISAEELSESVIGVISTRPAHLMNAGAGSDQTHPAVAVNGRVPVKVVGTVRKGDRLVSAGNGLARAGKKEEITAFNVLGRALEDKFDAAPSSILAIVKLNS